MFANKSGKWVEPRSNCSRKIAYVIPAALLALQFAGHVPYGSSQEQTPAQNVLSPDATVAANQQTGREAILGEGDLVQVDVFDVPELSRPYRVKRDGTISLPLLSKPILARGLTPEELSKAVGDALHSEGLVSHPEISVEVKESRVRTVAVGGAVRKPQVFLLYGHTTLLDVLARAEGLSDDAGSTVVITRGESGPSDTNTGDHSEGGGAESSAVATPDMLTVNVKDLMENKDQSLNVDVYPGDHVMVQRAGIVYVVGAVNHPGGFTLNGGHEQMTVLKALALAADVKGTAVKSRALIIRPVAGKAQTHQMMPVNLKEILSGRKPDLPLQADDILFVPDSSSSKALRRAAEAAIQVTTGVIIWRR